MVSVSCFGVRFLVMFHFMFVMPPTLKKWGGILVSACPYVRTYVLPTNIYLRLTLYA